MDMRLSVLKELQAKWIVSAYDHLRSHPEIGINGFKAAGIVKACEEPESTCDGTPSPLMYFN